VRSSLTLALDAAVSVGTVALFRDGMLAAEGAVPMRGQPEERLMPAVHEALRAAGATPADIDEVVCGAGPGSFTSLRIAAAIAKGIAAARGCPLRAVGSLPLLAAGALRPLPPGRYLAAIDAMRGECFAAQLTVDEHGLVTQEAPARIVARPELDHLAAAAGARTLGRGLAVEGAPHARGTLRVRDRPAVALDAWEPDYGRLAEAQVRWEATHGRPLSPR
jgi:tRNA threonylcarbamoyladenosine biosynthesis protein TsaB